MDNPTADAEQRAECPTCEGTGTILGGNRKCPDCTGTGVEQDSAELDAEQRNDPTAVDDEVAAKLVNAVGVLKDLLATQATDPDADTDPDDVAVSEHLKSAAAELDQANIAQAKDGAAEPRRKPRHRSKPLAPEYRRGIGREYRLHGVHGLEVRDGAAGSNTIEITGEPIVYDQPYGVMDLFGEFQETMKPGVVSSVLATADTRFLFNHDGLPLARTTSGTLKLTDSATALRFSAVLDARQQLANDLAVAIERGDVSQMSCGFVVADDAWNADWTERSIYRFEELLDVSAVTYPASPTTTIDIAARMMAEVPVESRTRVRKLWTFASGELRAGKVLSDENANHISNAAKALQSVLDNAGVAMPDDEEDDALGGDDGTQSAPDPSPAEAQDGTGSRSSAARLQLQLDLLKLRRRTA